MKSKSLKGSVVKAINEYNKYRSQEARAKLVRLSGKDLILDLKVRSAVAAGVHDYQDFICELQKFTMDVSVAIKVLKNTNPKLLGLNIH